MSDATSLAGRRLPIAATCGEWVESVLWYVVAVDAEGRYYLYPEGRDGAATKAMLAIASYIDSKELDRGRYPYPPDWMLRITESDLRRLAGIDGATPEAP